MLNEQLTCAVPFNCIKHTGFAGITEEHEGLQNETFDAILEHRDVEIDQQAGLDAGQLHVGQ